MNHRRMNHGSDREIPDFSVTQEKMVMFSS